MNSHNRLHLVGWTTFPPFHGHISMASAGLISNLVRLVSMQNLARAFLCLFATQDSFSEPSGLPYTLNSGD